MEYSDDYLEKSIPLGFPPEELVPGAVKQEFDGRSERLGDRTELLSRSTRWTYALFSELRSRQFSADGLFSPWSPRWLAQGELFSRVSLGLFDPHSEVPGFGFVFDALPGTTDGFEMLGWLAFPRLYGQRLPVATRAYADELHLAHPANGTGACWVRCNRTLSWGVLTAGHVMVGAPPGASVPILGGGSGTLIQTGYQPVDAAFVQTTPPTTPAPLATLSFPAAGQNVDVHLRGGSTSRTIVGTMNTWGVINTAQFGITFDLDNGFVPGDSGALVQLSSGEAIGIYRSAMKTNLGRYPVVGIAQNFEQALWALQVSAYL